LKLMLIKQQITPEALMTINDAKRK